MVGDQEKEILCSRSLLCGTGIPPNLECISAWHSWEEKSGPSSPLKLHFTPWAPGGACLQCQPCQPPLRPRTPLRAHQPQDFVLFLVTGVPSSSGGRLRVTEPKRVAVQPVLFPLLLSVL